jgi:proteasome-associated ATPase
VTAQNERLTSTLREARDQILSLKEEVDRLAQPPTGFGTFLGRNDDDSVDVFTGGRKLRVTVSPAVDIDQLHKGQEVLSTRRSTSSPRSTSSRWARSSCSRR